MCTIKITMVNRIQEILEKYNLTAARFADKLDVPRSTISHILSERNKPSLEFIQKVLDTFPEINVHWLLKGDGTIFKEQKDLFSGLESESIYEKETLPDREKPSEIFTEQGKDKVVEKYQNPEEVTDSVNPALDNVKPQEYSAKHNDRKGKKLLKILMIYEDKTFEEYFPSDDMR